MFSGANSKEERNLEVEVYFLLPSLNSLETQTRDRLREFSKQQPRVANDYWEDKVIKMSSSAERVMDDLLKRIEDNPDRFFIFLQDECHWGPKEGSMASRFTLKVLEASDGVR